MGRKKSASGKAARTVAAKNSTRGGTFKRSPVNKLLTSRTPATTPSKPLGRPKKTPVSSAAAFSLPATEVEERHRTADLLRSMKKTADASLWPLELAGAAPAAVAPGAGEGARRLSTDDYQPGLSELVPQRRASPPPQMGRGTQTDDIPPLVYSPPDHVANAGTSTADFAGERPVATILVPMEVPPKPPRPAKPLTPIKRHACPMCEKVMGSRSDLVKHVRIHTGERPYQCSFCPARFTQLGSLRAHETRHTGIKPFKCDVCDKCFSIKERLKVHTRIHTGERPFHCDLCEKSFARGSQLIQHKRTHTGDKPYTCSYCGMKFAFATNLKLHEKKHSGIKDFECPRCYKGFVRQDALKKHILSYHENERPMRCPICDKSFKGHLGTHLRVHTQEKPFVCPVCDAAFAQNSQLTVHQRVHTGVKPYGCQVRFLLVSAKNRAVVG